MVLFSDPQTYQSLVSAQLKKGDAIAVARIAGIQAAKKTSDLIPLAHPSLAITGLTLSIQPFAPRTLPPHHTLTPKSYKLFKNGGVYIEAKVDCEGKTGVEMEAMMGASVAGLTMYDMLKGIDKAMTVSEVRVLRKSGGKSGAWNYDYATNKVVKADKTDDTQLGARRSDREGSIRNYPNAREIRSTPAISQQKPSQGLIGAEISSRLQQQKLESSVADGWVSEQQEEERRTADPTSQFYGTESQERAKGNQSNPIDDNNNTTTSNKDNDDARVLYSEEIPVHHYGSIRNALIRTHVSTYQQDIDHGRLVQVSKVDPQLDVNRILDSFNPSEDEPKYERKVLLKRGAVSYRDLINARFRRWHENNDVNGAFFSISSFLGRPRS